MPFPTPATLKALDDKKRATLTESLEASETTGPGQQKTRSTRTSRSDSLKSTERNSSSKTNSPRPSQTDPSSSTGIEPTKAKPFRRTEHLTQKPLADNPDLLKLQAEFKEMEGINKDAGWYERDKNGKQRTPKGTKPVTKKETN